MQTGGVLVLTGLRRRRSVGFGQQRRSPSVSRGRRDPADGNIKTLPGCELSGCGEDVSGLPPTAEEVQGTHRQHVQLGRSADPQPPRLCCQTLKCSFSCRGGSSAAACCLRRLQGSAGHLLEGDEDGAVGLGSPSIINPAFRLQNKYVYRLPRVE